MVIGQPYGWEGHDSLSRVSGLPKAHPFGSSGGSEHDMPRIGLDGRKGRIQGGAAHRVKSNIEALTIGRLFDIRLYRRCLVVDWVAPYCSATNFLSGDTVARTSAPNARATCMST